ncbi:hypothetical protein EXIGLDRAFT_704969 [Exidia glandulosa HHB12029]|uniref:Uncharacterized protein n=1 Tax=Exidia glandulosa HHB12029 TaxID=1314781 RepID=A0A165BGX9_EXIGL|nr:hypothetical protein EXIGLDRAFT_704969 [Exidia glandulosa HHB12029]
MPLDTACLRVLTNAELLTMVAMNVQCIAAFAHMRCVSHGFKVQADYAISHTFYPAAFLSFYFSNAELARDVLRSCSVIVSGMAVLRWMRFPALDPTTSKAVLYVRSDGALQLADFLASEGYLCPDEDSFIMRVLSGRLQLYSSSITFDVFRKGRTALTVIVASHSVFHSFLLQSTTLLLNGITADLVFSLQPLQTFQHKRGMMLTLQNESMAAIRAPYADLGLTLFPQRSAESADCVNGLLRRQRAFGDRECWIRVSDAGPAGNQPFTARLGRNGWTLTLMKEVMFPANLANRSTLATGPSRVRMCVEVVHDAPLHHAYTATPVFRAFVTRVLAKVQSVLDGEPGLRLTRESGVAISVWDDEIDYMKEMFDIGEPVVYYDPDKAVRVNSAEIFDHMDRLLGTDDIAIEIFRHFDSPVDAVRLGRASSLTASAYRRSYSILLSPRALLARFFPRPRQALSLFELTRTIAGGPAVLYYMQNRRVSLQLHLTLFVTADFALGICGYLQRCGYSSTNSDIFYASIIAHCAAPLRLGVDSHSVPIVDSLDWTAHLGHSPVTIRVTASIGTALYTILNQPTTLGMCGLTHCGFFALYPHMSLVTRRGVITNFDLWLNTAFLDRLEGMGLGRSVEFLPSRVEALGLDVLGDRVFGDSWTWLVPHRNGVQTVPQSMSTTTWSVDGYLEPFVVSLVDNIVHDTVFGFRMAASLISSPLLTHTYVMSKPVAAWIAPVLRGMELAVIRDSAVVFNDDGVNVCSWDHELTRVLSGVYIPHATLEMDGPFAMVYIPPPVQRRLKTLRDTELALQHPNLNIEKFSYHEPETDPGTAIQGSWSMDGLLEWGFNFVGQLSAHHTFLGCEIAVAMHLTAILIKDQPRKGKGPVTAADVLHAKAKISVAVPLEVVTSQEADARILHSQFTVLQGIEHSNMAKFAVSTSKSGTFVYQGQHTLRMTGVSECLFRTEAPFEEFSYPLGNSSDFDVVRAALPVEAKKGLHVVPFPTVDQLGNTVTGGNVPELFKPGSWVDLACTMKVWDNRNLRRPGSTRPATRCYTVVVEGMQFLCEGTLEEGALRTHPIPTKGKRKFAAIAAEESGREDSANKHRTDMDVVQ